MKVEATEPTSLHIIFPFIQKKKKTTTSICQVGKQPIFTTAPPPHASHLNQVKLALANSKKPSVT